MNNCLKCSKETKNPKFCSKSCANAFNNFKKPKRSKEGKCKICNETISKSRSYCSKKCLTQGLSKPRKQEVQSSYDRVKSFRQRQKIKAVEYMGGCCKICGYSRCVRALSFHHIDPSAKEFRVSSKSYSWDRVLKELEKCVMLCSNCHMELHDDLIEIPNLKE